MIITSRTCSRHTQIYFYSMIVQLTVSLIQYRYKVIRSVI